MERKCKNCEYFDRHNGDCLNRLAPRFQTTADETCEHFYPDTTEIDFHDLCQFDPIRYNQFL